MRLVHNRFDDRLPPTIHGNYLTKQMRVDGQPVELNVWVSESAFRLHLRLHSRRILRNSVQWPRQNLVGRRLCCLPDAT